MYKPPKTYLVKVVNQVTGEVHEMPAQVRAVFKTCATEKRTEKPLGYDIFRVNERGFAQGLILPSDEGPLINARG